MSLLMPFTIAFLTLCSFTLNAADIPQDDLGTQQFNQMQCIDENTQACINSTCLNSEAIDCEDKCKTMAQEKCQQQSNE